MISLPLDIGEPGAAAGALDDLRDLAVAAPTGGMYPVGAHGLWHGGLHLSLGEEPPIYACASGRIVAARLDPDAERATCAYGHTNFLLTKHTWPSTASDEDIPFFVLYMHLAPRPLEAVAQRADVAPWLTGASLRRVTAESGLNVRRQPHPDAPREGGVPHGGLVKPDGAPTDRAGYRWQAVRVLRQDLGGYLALGPLPGDSDGDGGPLAEQWTDEAPPPGGRDLVGALAGGDIVQMDVPVPAGEMLWWGGRFGQDLSDWSDDLLALVAEAMGYPEPIERAPTVHWEVFSPEKAFGLEENGASESGDANSGDPPQEGSAAPGGTEGDGAGAGPSWTEAVDSGSTLTFDPEASDALALIRDRREAADDLPDDAADHALSLDEKQAIHLLEAGDELRTYAVKYASEWGLGAQGLTDALKESPAHDLDEDRGVFEAFQFWDEVPALPDDPTVWHYHPVTALKALAAQRPRFFANIAGEQKKVTTYENVRDLVFQKQGVPESISDIEELYHNDDQEDIPSYEAVVEGSLDGTKVTLKHPHSSSTEPFAAVEAGHIKDKQGNIEGWKGGVYDFASDTPDLYEMLIEEKKMRPGEPKKGVPGLPGFDRDVWAALSESEACLKGINTWDRALVTIGPIQQTLGTGGNRGELQGALHTVWRSAPDAYDRRLGRHGLWPKDDTVQLVQGAKKGHVTLHGEVLDSAAQKRQLQKFVWVDRLAEAFGEPTLRYWMLREGFRRLKRLRARNVTLHVRGQRIKTTIGALFRRDLSQALLLDWHVNAPALVWAQDETNQWLTPVQRQLEEWGITAPSQLTEDQELQLTATLLRSRMGNMTNPAGRAAKILRYAGSSLVEKIARSDGYNPTSYETQDAMITDFLKRELNVRAEEAWSDFASPQTVLTFEKYSGASRQN
jgi:hypothetical protein